MKTQHLSGFLSLLLCFCLSTAFAQSTKNDISVSKLPANVKNVLEEYVKILRNASDLDACAEKVLSVAGGNLVNESGESLRTDVKPYSLKKDFDNIKFYADPIKITRVNVSSNNGNGFGESAIKGQLYKIWIGKKDPANGMPAPVSIIVPEGHATIKTPKVVGIGSF